MDTSSGNPHRQPSTPTERAKKPMPVQTPANDHEPDDHDVSFWFVRRTGSDWRVSDEAAFKRWLQSGPDRQGSWQQWEADWALMDHLPADAAQRLRAQVQADRAMAGRLTTSTSVSVPRRRMWSAALALAGISAVSVALGWSLWPSGLQSPTYQQTFLTRPAEHSQLKLPDGSIVQMDTATRLQARFFADRREIHLTQGQAFFSVRHDASKPFHIQADTVRITVLGTRFNVRHTPEVTGREAVEVAVEEGSVSVAAADAAGKPLPTIVLRAGQGLAVRTDLEVLHPQTQSVDAVAPWRLKRLSFSNAPLIEVVAELQRYGALHVTEIDPEVAQLRLSATLNPTDAAGIRQLLSAALAVRFEQSAAGWRLVPTN